MSEPLKTTFAILASSRNGSAVDVLIRAVNNSDILIRHFAARALMSRQSTRGKVEIIRLYRELPADLWLSFKGNNDSFENALEQCLGHGETELKLNALEIIRLTGTYLHIPSIINAMNQREDNVLTDRAEETLRLLVSNLYDKSNTSDRVYTSGLSTPSAYDLMMAELDKASDRLSEQARPKAILESILILGTTQHSVVRKILLQSPASYKDKAFEILQTSIHPGVMKLLISQLGEKLPHPRMLSIIQNRHDLVFVTFLLRHLSKKITANQQRNLKQITSFPWINSADFDLALIPPALHVSLISLVVASGISATDKALVQQWMLKQGSAEGRHAAATLMTRLDDSQLQTLVLESLNSDDENVQVWATSQLRESNIPNAISLLVERLDSPEPAVRETARQELSSFNLPMVMEMSDFLDPLVCQRASQIMLKINPDAVHDLHRELANPLRGKRMKALKATRKMGLHLDMFAAIAPLAYDNDPMIRRTLIEVLSDVPTKEAGAVLHHLSFDSHERVRQEAQTALDHLASILKNPTPNLSKREGTINA